MSVRYRTSDEVIAYVNMNSGEKQPFVILKNFQKTDGTLQNRF